MDESSTSGLTVQNIGINLAAGALARCTAASVMFPVDVIKTRIQFQRNSASASATTVVGDVPLNHGKGAGAGNYRNVMDAFAQIARNEGLIGFYRGLPVKLLYIAPAAAVSFTVYDQCKRVFALTLQKLAPTNEKSSSGDGEMHDEKHQQKPKSVAVSAVLVPILSVTAFFGARLLGSMVRTPFDIVKQQLQLEGLFKTSRASMQPGQTALPHGIIGNIRYILQSQGMHGFFNGIAVTMLRDIPFSTIYFVSYEVFKKHLAHHQHWGSNEIDSRTVTHLIAGALAGGVATTCTIPADVVKTRLQTQSKLPPEVRRYNGIFDAFRTIFREEGFASLARGLTPRLIYIMPSSAITFASYEFLLRLLRRRHDSITTSAAVSKSNK